MDGIKVTMKMSGNAKEQKGLREYRGNSNEIVMKEC